MRLPNRKPGKYTFPTFDPIMTEEKLQQLKDKLNHIQTVTLPKAIKETRTYAENGDFSENAEYQIAKGRLRGLHRAVDELQYQINHAQVIDSTADTSRVQIGHRVTIASGTTEYTFHILGSSETDPHAGVISYTSPLGKALLGHRINETVEVDLGERKILYTIIGIE